MSSYQGHRALDVVCITGAYRVLNYTLTSRPILVTHGAYTQLLSNTPSGRLPLAGAPTEMEIEFNLNIAVTPVWKGRGIKYIRELNNVEIKGLAPGIVPVAESTSPFLFYGNMWIMLARTRVDSQENPYANDVVLDRDEDSQSNFMPAIQAMEQQHDAIRAGKPIISMKVKNHMPAEQKLMDADGFPFGDWRVRSNTGDVTATAKVMQAETGWKFPMCYRMVVDFMKKNNIKQLPRGE